MHQSLQIVTASTCEPLTLDEAKDWLRVGKDVGADEGLIDTLITAARKVVEDRTHRLFYHTTCALYVDGFPDDSTGVVRLPVAPLVSIESVTSYDSTDAATAMSSSDYSADTYSEPGRLSLRANGTWPTNLRNANGGRVLFVAGHSSSTGSGSTGVPAACQPMVQAMKLLLAHLYENRQQVTMAPGQTVALDLPYGVEYLLAGLTLPEVDG